MLRLPSSEYLGRNLRRSRLAALLLIPFLLLAQPDTSAAQTYDPGKGESPLVLLAVPKDGVAYYETKVRAKALVESEKYTEAEPLVEQLVRDYPRDPENWTWLGLVKRGLKKYTEAVAAYEKAGPLIGWDLEVNNLLPDKDETLDQLGLRLWTAIDKTRPKNLILDLRHNNGGTTQLYPGLLRTLVSFSRVPGNQLYALIGRRSFSATGNFVTDLERLTDPIFVGEASSECCNLYGDPTQVILPYSRTQGELTAVKWNLSTPSDRRREMSPEVPVQLTAKAYFAGQDPVMEAVYRMIAARKKG